MSFGISSELVEKIEEGRREQHLEAELALAVQRSFRALELQIGCEYEVLYFERRFWTV